MTWILYDLAKDRWLQIVGFFQNTLTLEQRDVLFKVLFYFLMLFTMNVLFLSEAGPMRLVFGHTVDTDGLLL